MDYDDIIGAMESEIFSQTMDISLTYGEIRIQLAMKMDTDQCINEEATVLSNMHWVDTWIFDA